MVEWTNDLMGYRLNGNVTIGFNGLVNVFYEEVVTCLPVALFIFINITSIRKTCIFIQTE